MEDDSILISQLNDFIFCPASIYFHNLYGGRDNLTFQQSPQLNGTQAHSSIDNNTYSSRKNILQGISVYSETYQLVGKIDLFDTATNTLTERKKKIKVIYDGYIFQIYAQYFALKEMGYTVSRLRLYSIDDNKFYPVDIPEKNPEMYAKFNQLIKTMRLFDLAAFRQSNTAKCQNCIYEPACDRSLL